MYSFEQMSERSFYYGTNNKDKNKKLRNTFPAIKKDENKQKTAKKVHLFGTEERNFDFNKYFEKNKTEKYAFYKIPKVLFTDEKYKTVSTDAKMPYGLLLDRMYLSAKNGWIDNHGRVYQFFTIKQGQELLRSGHNKIIKLFSELKKADLMQRKRQGQGKANIIYLKKF